jgi:hypothetical protein
VRKNGNGALRKRACGRIGQGECRDQSSAKSTRMAPDVLLLSETTNDNRHNVAPTNYQPVIRQVEERNNPAQDSQLVSDSPSSGRSPGGPNPGELIVQSMRQARDMSI